MPNAKIVVTLGPATEASDTIRALIRAGARIFRLNASHGTWGQHSERIELIRRAEKALGCPVAILLDLQGPKLRLGEFCSGGCTLKSGARFTITTGQAMGDETLASTAYEFLAADVRPGDRVLLNDGAVTLRARSNDGVAVEFDVIAGGPIGDHKGINLPDAKVSETTTTEKDLSDLREGLAAGVDFIALSFVRSAADVCGLRKRLGASHAPIIAKIETPQAVKDIDNILGAANGIMIARGDLGVEMPLETVPTIQKQLIQKARRRNRFVITATHMLESMIENSRPTRAEASDVANAIYDGTDALMLSAETSVGKFPIAAVECMARIAEEAENGIRRHGLPDTSSFCGSSDSDAIADAAYRAARIAGAKAIVVFTATGSGARCISRYRPTMKILAMTPSLEIARRLLLNYGVSPVVVPDANVPDPKTIHEMIGQSESLLVEQGHLKPGDKVIFVADESGACAASVNLMKLDRVAG
jgi:pyruvate kinase